MEFVSAVVEAMRSRSSPKSSTCETSHGPIQDVNSFLQYCGASCHWMRSFASYVVAPPLERRCMFAIAARTDPSDLEQFKAPFTIMDVDSDGRISRSDLVVAFETLHVRIDVDVALRAMDLDGSNSITFIEFVAACLHSRLAPLDDWLAEEVFNSLDLDQDSMLGVDDVVPVFGTLPAGLPRQRKFDRKEWCSCICPRNSGSTSVSGPMGVEVLPLSHVREADVFNQRCQKVGASNVERSCNWDPASDSVSAGERPSLVQPLRSYDTPINFRDDEHYARVKKIEGKKCRDHVRACSSLLSSPPYVPMSVF
eukprot:TRINITY_DN31069_c0_g1_i1.p1 TRINITY_DN31069_c0_g1~~TRINITY_DN31069_c0_g1_i1.p1  ORF type:complete len:310 (-),score=40.78 TRINITY_DN31069_c0_g1_i1:593-1522(-)